jgi:hypothetical protein
VWSVSAKILNNQSRVTDSESGPSGGGLGVMPKIPRRMCSRSILQGFPDVDGFFVWNNINTDSE